MLKAVRSFNFINGNPLQLKDTLCILVSVKPVVLGNLKISVKKLTERQADRQTDAGLESDQNSLRELTPQP